MSLFDIYADYLDAMSIEKERDPLRLFVTDVGRCPRQVALRLTGAKAYPITKQQRYQWDIAEYIEETLMRALDVANLLCEYQGRIDITDRENWGGRIDISHFLPEATDTLRIVEVKSTDPNSFSYVDFPKEWHVNQITVYDHYYDYAGYKRGTPTLTYFDRSGRSGNEPKEYEVKTDFERIRPLMDELDAMRSALPDLPPILPRVLKEFKDGKDRVLKQGPAWQCKPTTKQGYCPYSGLSCHPNMSWNKWGTRHDGSWGGWTDSANLDDVSAWANENAHEALLAAL